MQLIEKEEQKIKSKFKIFGGFGVIMFISLALTFCAILYLNLVWEEDPGEDVTIFWLIICAWLLALLWLGSQTRRIKVYQDRIIFYNLFFPFLRKTKYFDDYDYQITIQESSQYNSYDAIWLVENQRLQRRISSFYYKNYMEIKGAIKVKNGGRKKFDAITQIGYLFGGKLS